MACMATVTQGDQDEQKPCWGCRQRARLTHGWKDKLWLGQQHTAHAERQSAVGSRAERRPTQYQRCRRSACLTCAAWAECSPCPGEQHNEEHYQLNCLALCNATYGGLAVNATVEISQMALAQQCLPPEKDPAALFAGSLLS